MENSLQNGLVVTVIGIAIVFLGLTVLIGLIKVMTLVIDRMSGRKVKKAAESVKVPEPAPAAAAPAPVVEDLPEEEDEGQVVAAIMAALSCVMGGETGSFRVRRIRRV